MKTSLTVTLLLLTGFAQAGLFETVVRAPGRAVRASGDIVRSSVVEPENFVRETVTAPAKVLGVAPEQQNQPITPTSTAPAVDQQLAQPIVEQPASPIVDQVVTPSAMPAAEAVLPADQAPVRKPAEIMPQQPLAQKPLIERVTTTTEAPAVAQEKPSMPEDVVVEEEIDEAAFPIEALE